MGCKESNQTKKAEFVLKVKSDKDQESIQSSTTPDPGYHMEKWQNTIKQHKEEPSGQPFLNRWPQGSNEQTRRHDTHKTYITQMIHKRRTALERSIKYFARGLKPVLRRQPHPKFWCESRHIDVWFAWKTPNLSMHHLLEHINQDIKRKLSKDTDSTVLKNEYWRKRNPTGKPRWSWQQLKHQAPTISPLDQSLCRNRHRNWSPTHLRAIKIVCSFGA